MSAKPGKLLGDGRFRVAKAVTVPHFKMEKDVEYYFQFVGAMERAKDVKKVRKVDGSETASSERKTPPMMARVIDLTTGELGQIICPTVLVSELDDNYPGSSYVGRGFAITMYRVAGKDYNLIELTEIEPAETPESTTGGNSDNEAIIAPEEQELKAAGRRGGRR